MIEAVPGPEKPKMIVRRSRRGHVANIRSVTSPVACTCTSCSLLATIKRRAATLPPYTLASCRATGPRCQDRPAGFGFAAPPSHGSAAVCGWLARGLRELFDDVEQFSAVVAALAAELDEFDRLGEQRAALGCAADTDSMALAEFE